MVRDIRQSNRLAARPDRAFGGVFPVAVWAVAQVAFNGPRRRLADPPRRHRRGLEPARPGLRQPAVLPAAAVRGRLQRGRPASGAPRTSAPTRPTWPPPTPSRVAAGRARRRHRRGRRPGRPGDGVRLRPRPRHLAAGRAGAGRPRARRRAGSIPPRSRAWCSTHAVTDLRLLGTTRVNVLELNLALDRIPPCAGRLGRRARAHATPAAALARAAFVMLLLVIAMVDACCPSARTRRRRAIALVMLLPPLAATGAGPVPRVGRGDRLRAGVQLLLHAARTTRRRSSRRRAWPRSWSTSSSRSARRLVATVCGRRRSSPPPRAGRALLQALTVELIQNAEAGVTLRSALVQLCDSCRAAGRLPADGRRPRRQLSHGQASRMRPSRIGTATAPARPRARPDPGRAAGAARARRRLPDLDAPTRRSASSSPIPATGASAASPRRSWSRSRAWWRRRRPAPGWRRRRCAGGRWRRPTGCARPCSRSSRTTCARR